MDIKAYEDFLQIVDSIAGSEMSFRYEVERERGCVPFTFPRLE